VTAWIVTTMAWPPLDGTPHLSLSIPEAIGLWGAETLHAL
jgi:hypothetical protein